MCLRPRKKGQNKSVSCKLYDPNVTYSLFKAFIIFSLLRQSFSIPLVVDFKGVQQVSERIDWNQTQGGGVFILNGQTYLF
jgi:hypothetical protein